MSSALDDQNPCVREMRRDFLPASDYSREFHLEELDRLWPRVWQIACREQEIFAVGDYVNYEIGNESILVIRSAPGEIRAFYNVCPHRGRRLRDDARGNLKRLTCGYHAWSFDLEGRPVSIPSREDWAGCPAISDDDLSLTGVKVDTWAGWVWINMDPDCEPLGDFLQYLPAKTDAFEWDRCRIRSYQTIVFPVNWKVVIEAFIEGYHTVGTHPELLLFGDIHSPGFDIDIQGEGRRHGSHMSFQHYELTPDAAFVTGPEYVSARMEDVFDRLRGIVHEDGLAAAQRLRDELPPDSTIAHSYAGYSRLLQEQMAKVGVRYPSDLTDEHFSSVEWQIFPNSSVLPSPEGAFWYRIRPNGTDYGSTIFDLYVLGRYAPGAEPDWQHEFYPTMESFKGKNPILEQDFSNLLAVQKGIQSRSFKGARPSPLQENNVYNLHRVLRAFMAGEPY